MSAEIDPPTRRVVPDSTRSVTVPSRVPTQEERDLAEANRRIDNYTSKLATSNPSCWAGDRARGEGVSRGCSTRSRPRRRRTSAPC